MLKRILPTQSLRFVDLMRLAGQGAWQGFSSYGLLTLAFILLVGSLGSTSNLIIHGQAVLSEKIFAVFSIFLVPLLIVWMFLATNSILEGKKIDWTSLLQKSRKLYLPLCLGILLIFSVLLLITVVGLLAVHFLAPHMGNGKNIEIGLGIMLTGLPLFVTVLFLICVVPLIVLRDCGPLVAMKRSIELVSLEVLKSFFTIAVAFFLPILLVSLKPLMGWLLQMVGQVGLMVIVIMFDLFFRVYINNLIVLVLNDLEMKQAQLPQIKPGQSARGQ